MKKYRVISITNIFGESLPIDKMEFSWVDENSACGHFKGYGFSTNYGPWDLWTVTTEEITEE